MTIKIERLASRERTMSGIRSAATSNFLLNTLEFNLIPIGQVHCTVLNNWHMNGSKIVEGGGGGGGFGVKFFVLVISQL